MINKWLLPFQQPLHHKVERDGDNNTGRNFYFFVIIYFFIYEALYHHCFLLGLFVEA